MTSLDQQPLLPRINKKLRLALQRLLPPGPNYLGTPYNPKKIEVRVGDEIQLSAIRQAIEDLATQLRLNTSSKIRALLEIPGHNPFGGEALLKIAKELEPAIDAFLGRKPASKRGYRAGTDEPVELEEKQSITTSIQEINQNA